MDTTLTTRESILLQLIGQGKSFQSLLWRPNVLLFGWAFSPEFYQDVNGMGKFDFDSLISKISQDMGFSFTTVDSLPRSPDNLNYFLPFYVYKAGVKAEPDVETKTGQ